MIITQDDLFKGKEVTIKDNLYRSAQAYVEPFLERMSKYTSDFRIQARLPECLTVDQQNGEDIWYPRVWVQAVMPEEYSINNHQETVGMIYALDTRKPIVKIYRGMLNMACLNLCIWQSSFLVTQEIEPNKAINYKPVQALMEQTCEAKVWLDKLDSTEVPYDEVNEYLGLWVRNALNKSYDNGVSKAKLAASTVIDAYKLLYEDKSSPYYVKPGETTTMFTVYNSFTELITNDGNKENRNEAKDILTKPDKVLLLKEILELQ